MPARVRLRQPSNRNACKNFMNLRAFFMDDPDLLSDFRSYCTHDSHLLPTITPKFTERNCFLVAKCDCILVAKCDRITLTRSPPGRASFAPDVERVSGGTLGLYFELTVSTLQA